MRSGRRLLIVIIGIVIAISASVLFTDVGEVAFADSSEVLTLLPASNMAMATAEGSVTTAIPVRQPYNPDVDVYLTGVRLGQTANTIKSHFANSERVKIYNSNGIEIGDNDRVGTGYVVRLYNSSQDMIDEITICIKGDVDGDGYIDSDDVTAISMHMRGNVLLQGAYLVAADVYPTIGGDGYISGQDKIYMSLQVSNLILHPTTYTITFDSNGGSTVTSITEEAGETIIPPTAPTRTGYTFNGWFSDVSLTTAYTFTTMPEENITVYAKWTARTNTVSLHRQGGSGGTTSVTATYDLPMPTATAPTRLGHIFSGHFTGTNGSGDQYYTSTMASARLWDRTANTTLYAYWTPIEYTIVYNGNGATSGAMQSSEHIYNVTKALNINGFENDGHVFAGWSTTAGGNVAYSDGQSVSNLSTVQGVTVTLYAKWARLNTLIFDGNGATSGIMEDQIIPEGFTVNLIPNQFEKTDKVFAGWNTMADGSGTYHYDMGLYTMGSNSTYTLYAQWALPSTNGLLFTPIAGGYEVSIGTCTDNDIVIPSTYNGQPVLKIADNGFSDCSFITSISIPNTVVEVGVYAFSYCTGLTDITIPNSVEIIGSSAFMGCSGLISMTIPFTGRTLASSGTEGLFGYIFGTEPYEGGHRVSQQYASSTSIDYYIVTSIRSVTLTNGTSVKYGAFWNCGLITSITVPNNIISVSYGAFYQSGITSINLPNTVQYIGLYAFAGCRNLTHIDLPSELVSIGNLAFSRSALQSIVIHSKVTSIEYHAFGDCKDLISVTVNRTTPPTIHAKIFERNHIDMKIYVPSSAVDTYKAASGWSTHASRIYAIA